jgi:CHAT domain-containing protein
MAAYRQLILVGISLLAIGDRAAPSWRADYDRTVQWFNRAEFEQAREAAGRGYRRWQGQPTSAPCWHFRLALAEALIELDRIDEARPLLGTPAPFAEQEARRLSDLALVHLRTREPGLTIECLDKARRLAPASARDLWGKIELIGGTVELQGDRMSEAEASFRRALDAVRGTRSLMESYALSDLGFLDHRRFRYDEAMYWFEQARDVARQNGMRRALVLALGNLGSTYHDLGDNERAIVSLQDAVKLGQDLGDRVYRGRWLVVLGDAWNDSGDSAKAAECYQQARRLGHAGRDQEWLAGVLDDLSQIALRKNDLASAEDLNRQGVALAREAKSSATLLYQQVQSAAIAEARHDQARADTIYSETLAASLREGNPVAAFQCHTALASLSRRRGANARAEREYRAAATLMDNERAKLSQDESKFSFFENLTRFYRDYVDFLMSRGDDAAAFRIAQSCRARVLEERLHRGGKGDAAADLRSLERQARSSRVVLLSYWLAPRQSILWVIDSAGLHHFFLPAESEIEEHVRRYDAAIQRGDNPAESGGEAGQWLFTNLLGAHYRVPVGTNVVIEPDGVLHQLNFESLPVTDGGRYWIEDVTVSVAPSLALLRQSTYLPPRGLLLFGDPGFAGTQFQELKNARPELEAIANHFSEKSVYVASAATPAAYRAAHPETFAALHFASHAIANRESPLDSAIVLAGPAESRKLYAREILEQPLAADLVTLSACRTAGSRTYHGEGLTGFAWAFLSAGASNVVAGLWDVDDRASASLMSRFYDHLSAGLSPASALRRAKLDLIGSGGAYRKPRYWAPFETFSKALYR